MFKLQRINSSCFRRYCRSIFSKTGIWDEEVTLAAKLEIEKHWKSVVETSSYNEKSKKPKFYVLAMFPYPSGSLHMGHARVYTISDTIARYHRMNGKNVIHPMGWDAFGLPAENAARDRGLDAEAWTQHNIEAMRRQLSRLGLCLDWQRELNTASPKYYAGTQKIFLRLWRAGLVYQDQSMVNWDPVDKTVLADEQVDSQGRSWRSGAAVERRLLTQWFIRTTKFSRALLEGLDSPLLQDWRDIIQLQKHWIGTCDGTMLTFDLENCKSTKVVMVWTRQPEQPGLFVAISRNHPLNCSENLSPEQPCPEVALRLKLTVKNLIHGTSLPLIVCDMEENKRDDYGYLGVNSCESDIEISNQLGLAASVSGTMSRQQALDAAKQLGIGGEDGLSANLRDWLISRQRRWGTPIPLVKCKSSCGVQAVPDDQLPVTVPAPEIDIEQWKLTSCPKCGGPAGRETDTMDTFVDSSWYFLRFLDPHNLRDAFDPATVAPFMPVDLYVGGKEHAVLHLYYARFMCHFLHSIGLVQEPEPFRRLLVQGMVMGKSYQVKNTGKYLPATQVDVCGDVLTEKHTGEAVVQAWEKMSKSKFNGVDPNSVLDELGCDATRLLLLADVAPTSTRKWSSDTYPGILNWQHRLWLTVRDFLVMRRDSSACPAPSPEQLQQEEERLWDSRNFYISGTTFNYCNSQQLSVAVSKLQGLTNSLRRTPKNVMGRSGEFERALAAQVVMLAPMAPHFASELWAGLTAVRPMLTDDFDWDKPVLEQNWPKLDKEFMLDFKIKINHIDVESLKIAQSVQKLSKEGITELALKQESVLSVIGSLKVAETKLDVKHDYEVNINFILDAAGKVPRIQRKKKQKSARAV